MAQVRGNGDSPRRCEVALVDNDSLVLSLLAKIIAKQPGLTVAWTARSGDEGLETFRKCMAGINSKPDIVITDISMKGMSGFELASAIRFEDGDVPVLGATSYDPYVYEREAFDSGMQGIVAKDEIEHLVRAVCLLVRGVPMHMEHGGSFETAAAAHARLTSQEKPAMLLLSDNEREVMDLCVQGFSTRQIAERLGISSSTVKTYVSRAARKLDVRSRREAVAVWAKKTGM